MKQILTLLSIALTLYCGDKSAQLKAQSRPQAQRVDSTLIEQQTTANAIVSRYRVDSLMGVDYQVLYRINTSTLSSDMDNNRAELAQLETLVKGLSANSENSSPEIVITGYSSPDGPQEFNQKLAKARADNFTHYADKRYGLSGKYNLKSESVAQKWQAIAEAVESHPVPRKESVLAIVRSSVGEEEKQARLEAMPEVWSYLKSSILPPMRRVEIEVRYVKEDIVISQVKVTPKPQPQQVKPTPKSEPQKPCDDCTCDVVEESITGIIVEMPKR